MTRHLTKFLFLALISIAAAAGVAPQLAVVRFQGDEKGEWTEVFRTAASPFSPQLSILDPDQVASAIRGINYSGGLNLSLEEARSLGLSIGCDYFILGKISLNRRIVSANQFYYEASGGLFLVETRSGCLKRFLPLYVSSELEAKVKAGLSDALTSGFRSVALSITSEAASDTSPPATPGLTIIDTTARTPSGLISPVFYQRLKPPYTDQARRSGVIATVELEVVFLSDGRVGKVDVIRWAGFGLDESAVTTVRQLRFKPAELGGRKVSILARVQYNFR